MTLNLYFNKTFFLSSHTIPPTHRFIFTRRKKKRKNTKKGRCMDRQLVVLCLDGLFRRHPWILFCCFLSNGYRAPSLRCFDVTSMTNASTQKSLFFVLLNFFFGRCQLSFLKKGFPLFQANDSMAHSVRK